MAYRFIDLFCGCGGLSKGFSLAGFDCVGGIDFNQAAINTFNHNFEGAKGICCDLLQMSTEQIIEEFGVGIADNLVVLLQVDSNHLFSILRNLHGFRGLTSIFIAVCAR